MFCSANRSIQKGERSIRFFRTDSCTEIADYRRLTPSFRYSGTPTISDLQLRFACQVDCYAFTVYEQSATEMFYRHELLSSELSSTASTSLHKCWTLFQIIPVDTRKPNGCLQCVKDSWGTISLLDERALALTSPRAKYTARSRILF